MNSKIRSLLLYITTLCFGNVAQAATPLWTFTPLTATTITVSPNSTAAVQYLVTNKSKKTHTLVVQPVPGITQVTGGGVCANPFTLSANASCTLSLQVSGSQLSQSIADGPVVCEKGSIFQCYRPSSANILRITQEQSSNNATIAISGNSILNLVTNGQSGTFTLYNSSQVTATNIMSDFSGTALDSNVQETTNTCANLPPQSSCILTYTPGNSVVPQTNFTIQGNNTNTLTATIEISGPPILNSIGPSSGPGIGGAGVTLSGTGLSGVTGVTFGGTQASSVNVVNSTTVTAVTPAHVAGVVDVVVTDSNASATLTNAYTFLPTAVGQSTQGGVIACLNGGINNLIAAQADNAISAWGGTGTNTLATSTSDGAANTATIVAALGANGGVAYAAQQCDDYEVDSQGNTPCVSGNACYNDWFLPAGNNVTSSGQLNCLYTNRVAIGGFTNAEYLSSTEANQTLAWAQAFLTGTQNTVNKSVNSRVRCVRVL